MIGLAKTIIPFALVFGAIALLSAFALSRACSVGIGRRVARPVDPYLHPFGEITPLPAGSIIELHEHSHSVGLATRADQGSGGDGKTSQGAAAARQFVVADPLVERRFWVLGGSDDAR